jgi:bla regulator protein blaR1
MIKASGASRAIFLMVRLSLVAASQLCAQAAAQQASPPAQPAAASQQPAHADAAPGATAQLPAFDVVSVKTHKDEGMVMRIGVSATPDGFQADGVPLQMLIRQAFGLSEDRIQNEPDWTRSARFDINAKVAPEDAPKLKALSMQQRSGMILPLLEDRFGLKYHHETRELQVYTLVVAKGGPKLKEAAPAESGGEQVPPPPSPPGGMGGPGGGGARGSPGGPRTMMRMSTQGMTLDARGTTTASLSQIISQQIGATVVDKTGLTGKYDLTLSFMPDNFMMNGRMMGSGGGGSPGDSGAQTQEPVGPSLFTAVQEQLGLKLVAGKESVDVIVIDHVEQPSAN